MIAIDIIAYLTLFGLLAVASYSDIKKHIIPNKIVLSIIVLGFLYRGIACFYIGNIDPIIQGLLGFFAGAVPFLIIILITKSLGAGDMKLYGALGLFFGVKLIFFLIMISIFIAAVFSLVFLITKRINMKSKIPLAPFISAAALITTIFADKLINLTLF